MCGRYYIASEDTAEELRKLIDELNRREREKANRKTPKIGEVFPADDALVVANNRKLVPCPYVMQWGFSEDGKNRIINARSETAHSTPMFRDLITSRRALIPASGYFEWDRADPKKTKYAFSTEENFICMAGLYRPKKTADGYEFIILTQDAAPGIRGIHPRMPVIFSRETASAWLSADADPKEVLKQSLTNIKYKAGNMI